MGQFLDYFASVFSSKVEASKVEASKEKVDNHVTFDDNPSTQDSSEGNSNNEQATMKIVALAQSNKKTILFYQGIGALAFIAHLSMVTVPRFQLDTFDLLEPDGWKLVTLSLVPLLVYLASIGAMHEINKPISEGTILTKKNYGLDLNNNQFIFSLKVIILLMSVCQVSSIFSDQLLWPVVLIVPIWCYQLTTKVAQSEYERFAPSPLEPISTKSPKKQWKLRIARSPKTASPNKPVELPTAKQDNTQVRATPRTRTRRVVKNIITGVSDKYHALEETVAHQLSQKIFTPMSPRVKMINANDNDIGT